MALVNLSDLALDHMEGRIRGAVEHFERNLTDGRGRLAEIAAERDRREVLAAESDEGDA